MSSRAVWSLLNNSWTPFLYPCLDSTWRIATPSTFRHVARKSTSRTRIAATQCRRQTTASHPQAIHDSIPPSIDVNQYDHLTPTPPDYSSQPFADACTLSLHAGAGVHGCISFLREKYISHGPPNGGDGGTGGNVYIQAVRGETSLHKLARRGVLKAGRGKNGEGTSKGGRRGEDVVLQVPVGTVVREVTRHDPLDEEMAASKRDRGYGSDAKKENEEDGGYTDQTRKWRRDKWLLYPGTLPKSFTSADFPALPRPRRSNLVAAQPPAPLCLDLDKPMNTPMLLAAGAMGGLGNPHFVTKSIPRPKYATKGEEGVRIQLQLELKLLADVGLVGLPNAGKSTLLRALTRSRTRVGDWAFTTLAPNVGTVVLDSHRGRPALSASGDKQEMDSEPRTRFTIADIPGLIEDAHLDRGLGLGFLRHIERAAVLAFVVDLSAGDAVEALEALWKEVGEYEKLRGQEGDAEAGRLGTNDEGMMAFRPLGSSKSPDSHPEPTGSERSSLQSRMSSMPPISSKPWFVIATKADLPATEHNFPPLQQYLAEVQAGRVPHPSGRKDAWNRHLYAMPVSAIDKENGGVGKIPEVIVSLLEG